MEKQIIELALGAGVLSARADICSGPGSRMPGLSI